MTDTAMPTATARRPHNHQHSQIRIAGRDEENDLVKICHELWQENGIFSFSEKKVRDLLRRSFDAKGGMIGVIGAPGAIEACAYLIIEQYYYTEDWYLGEMWNYVRPDFRRTPHAKTLVRWAKTMADQLGLRLFIGVVSNDRTQAKIRLYQREFGPLTGAYFVYTPKKLLS